MEYKTSIWGSDGVARARDPTTWPQNRAKSLEGHEIWRATLAETEKWRQTGTLCEMCCTISFEALFSKRFMDNKDEVILGYLDNIKENHSCVFCCLLIETLCEYTGLSDLVTAIGGERVKCDLRPSKGELMILEDGSERWTVDIHVCCVPVLPPAHVVPENLAASQFMNCRPLNTPWPNSMFSTPSQIKLRKLRTGHNPNDPCAGREISTKIDCNLLKSWLQSCSICKRDRLKDQVKALPSSFALIDVTRNCLVEAPSNPEYAILSYVWGDIGREFLLALKNNFESLKIQDSLNPQNKLLPNTIRDAIILTKNLEYQYLWVDSICIVQDDPSSIIQINAMDVIYSLAAFTIVAASGTNSDAGIAGSLDTPRIKHQFKAEVQGNTLANHLNYSTASLDASHWNTRAWCFQERVLSPRLLVFDEAQAHYQCAHDHRDEQKHRNDNMLEGPPDSHRINAHGVPYWPGYILAVANFSSRNLTVQSDVLRAFAGIMSYFKPFFGGEYIFGIPELVLDLGLLWHAKESLLHRDMGIKSPIPSYSWAAWVGKVGRIFPITRMMAEVGTYADVKSLNVGSLRGCTFSNKFSVHLDFPVHTSSRVLWKNQVAGSRQSAFISQEYINILRPGREAGYEFWREKGDVTNHSPVQDPHKVFRYDSPSDGALQFWAHCLRVSIGPLNEAEIGDDLHKHLGFENKQNSRLDYYNGTHRALLDTDRNIIGSIHMDSIETSGSLEQGTLLIMSRAFSKGFEPSNEQLQNGFDWWKQSGEPWDIAQLIADSKHTSVETGRYNVLLVDTITGVSHRLGVGVLFLAAFHQHSSTRHFITLG